MQNKFQQGQTIAMTEDCGRSPKKGEKLKVLEHLDGTPIVYGDNNLICSCQDKWELVEPELTLVGVRSIKKIVNL